MGYTQVVRFLRATKTHCTQPDYTLFHTLADTGVRRGEALALEWPAWTSMDGNSASSAQSHSEAG